MTMECMGRQALACFVGTTESEHKGYFYSTSVRDHAYIFQFRVASWQKI